MYESKDKSYKVQILKQQPDKLYEIGEGQFVGEMLILEVSVFDVLKPMVGDIFIIGKRKYKVYSPPLRDNSGIIWKIPTIGKIQKTRRGAKVGKHEFIGAFTATMPRGNSGVFRREGRTALPIQEVKLALEPEASRIIENLVNYEVEEVSAKSKI